MSHAIDIGNKHQPPKKMDSRFSDFLSLLMNVQKSDSFAAHFKQYLNTTMSCTYLRKYMAFKLIKQLNLIGEMKIFTQPN